MIIRDIGSGILRAASISLFALAIGMLPLSTSQAQDVPGEIQRVANQLARQGYVKFRLKNEGDAQMILLAEQERAAVTLYFNAETMKITGISAGVDENGDGMVSLAERRQVHLQDQTMDAERLALQVAEEAHIRAREHVESAVGSQVRSASQSGMDDSPGSGSSGSSAGMGSSGSGAGGSGSGGSGNGGGGSGGNGMRM